MHDAEKLLVRALQGGLKTQDPASRASPVDLTVGVVDQVLSGRLSVRVATGTIDLAYLALWTPQEGQKVLIARQGSGLFVVLGPLSE